MSKHKVVWRGVEDEAVETFAYGRVWEANMPQQVDDSEGFEETYSERVEATDGTYRLVERARLIPYIEKMRGNPCFDVDDEIKPHKKRERPKAYPNASQKKGGDYRGTEGLIRPAMAEEPLAALLDEEPTGAEF